MGKRDKTTLEWLGCLGSAVGSRLGTLTEIRQRGGSMRGIGRPSWPFFFKRISLYTSLSVQVDAMNALFKAPPLRSISLYTSLWYMKLAADLCFIGFNLRPPTSDVFFQRAGRSANARRWRPHPRYARARILRTIYALSRFVNAYSARRVQN